MGSNTAVFGGLLKGLGKGMVDQGAERRTKAEQMRKEALERVRRQEDRDFRSSQVTNTITDTQGRVHGITPGGEAKDLGITAPQPKGLLSAQKGNDDLIWDQVVQSHTAEDSDGEKTDWAGVAATLREIGREDLAQRVASTEGSSEIDQNSPAWFEAKASADKWVDAQAKYGNFDETDFKDFGGNREQARQAKTLEFYNQLVGGSQPSAATAAPSGGEGGNPQAQNDQPEPSQYRSSSSSSSTASSSAGGGSSKPQAQSGQSASEYKSDAEVRDAMRAGTITREQALKILRSQFGYQ